LLERRLRRGRHHRTRRRRRCPTAVEAIKWAGIAYLAFLATEAIRSAAAGRYLPFDHEKLAHQFRSRAGGKDSAVARNGDCRRRLTE